MGRYWSLDFQLSGIYDTTSLVPLGDNYYQYMNPTYDSTLANYEQEFNPVLRTQYAHQLQAILYEDLPSISVIYFSDLYGFKSGLTGINPLLLSTSNQRIENWDDPIDHILKYAVPADLVEQNIFVQESYFEGIWMQNTYGSLFSRNPTNLMWEPNIATDCIITDGGTNLTVTIDPNAKFSDGNEVLAEDVKFSYELYMSPAVGSSSYGYLTKWFANNDSIVEMNSNTISFILPEPYNFPLSLLSYGIIDKSDVEAKIDDYGYDIFNQNPGTGDVEWSLVKSCGPMMLDDYDSVLSVVKLLQNPHWHGESVKLNEWYEIFISGKDNGVAELIAGNIDILDCNYFPVLADFEEIAGVEGVLVSDSSHQEMSVNMLHPILGTGELTPVGTTDAARSIDKLGSPGILPIPKSCIGFNETLEPYSYNFALSKEYMKAAGYDHDTCSTDPDPTAISFPNLYLIIIMFLGLTVVPTMFRGWKKN
jgi:ABC-type transport system substrate-binding protein